jgi:aminoglycoside phosphotransferase (APT) family kinase protein
MEFPVRVGLRKPDGVVEHCVIKLGASLEYVLREAQVLRALTEIGLPVPKVLLDPEGSEGGRDAMMVMSVVPGQSLRWIALESLKEANLTCELLIQGVQRLHELTEPMKRHDIARNLPQVTLSSELEEVIQRGGRWLDLEGVAAMVERLKVALPQVETPLVFTNGDYNPLNFLFEGESLSGWIDFEHARFEDPHIGFTRFFLWAEDDFGWGTGKKAGLVERWLYAHNLTRREFAPRLALRCLSALVDDAEGQPELGEPQFYFKQLPGLLRGLEG